MSINETKSIHATEDWGVVLQSVPSKNKKEIVKRLGEIFGLEKRDAEQILSNMPLILLDNLSYGSSSRIKTFFKKIGAVAETTNHDMIKKNCFQIVWPQTPDLSFFMKDETGPVAAPVQEKKTIAKSTETPSAEKKPASYDRKPEAPKVQETPAIASESHPVAEEKAAAVLSSHVDSDWERRAKELNERLRKIHEEKKDLHVQHAEAAEKVKDEYEQQIELEKQRSEEIAKKAYEDLQKEAQKHEELTREGEEWRSKAMVLSERVRELETDLSQKAAAVQEGEAWRSRAGSLEGKIHELEANLQQRTSAVEHLIQQKDDLLHQSEKVAVETQQELATFRSREQEFSKKIEGLERNVQEMTESLQSRDGVLAQFEKQIMELAEKARGYESLRQEHAQLAEERNTIRQEYDTKLVEQEVRLAKAEEDHRRYRSRMDRKNAAATRELGEWIRSFDTIRQGLQKLILFLGSESAVLDSEKKSSLRSPLTRGPDAPNTEKS